MTLSALLSASFLASLSVSFIASLSISLLALLFLLSGPYQFKKIRDT